MNSATSGTSNAAKRWTLPLFLTQETKYFYGVILFLTAAFLYLASNHFHLSEPQLLHMTWIDRSTPFIPQTVWIYVGEYILFVSVYITCRDMVNLNKYFYSFLAMQTLSVAIFWIWPTTYPRDGFPLPSTLDPVTYYLFSSLRASDTPANCCPSLHVSSVYLSSFIFLDEQREKFWFFFVWATAIAVSTLTTKQHYVIDVIAGLFSAFIFYWVFHHRFEYRKKS